MPTQEERVGKYTQVTGVRHRRPLSKLVNLKDLLQLTVVVKLRCQIRIKRTRTMMLALKQ
ncbi:unnamed protein product [Brassica oleracea var. botrytis]